MLINLKDSEMDIFNVFISDFGNQNFSLFCRKLKKNSKNYEIDTTENKKKNVART